MEKEVKAKLKPAILDPSVLCVVDFWKTTTNLKRIFPVIYVPESIKQIEDIEFRKFYGGRLHTEKILSVEEVIKRSRETFESFSWDRYSAEIPEQFRVGFRNLRRGLADSYIAESIQQALLDEFVFATTQSSILSRLKKPFKLFEKFDAIPLINLEKRAPDEWKQTVRGVKKASKFVSYIAFNVGFSILLGPGAGTIAGHVATFTRLLLVDP